VRKNGPRTLTAGNSWNIMHSQTWFLQEFNHCCYKHSADTHFSIQSAGTSDYLILNASILRFGVWSRFQFNDLALNFLISFSLSWSCFRFTGLVLDSPKNDLTKVTFSFAWHVFHFHRASQLISLVNMWLPKQ
jgi:hypothetical protein